MANLNVLDGAGSGKYIKTSGAGDNGDPHIPEHLETNSAAIKTAVETIDNAISGSEMQVDVVAALPAGENHVGQIGTDDTVIDVTASLDTSAYTSGDVLFDTQSVSSVGRVNAGVVVLQSLFVLDEDDQGAAMDIYFLDANNSLGTENSAPNISDANARNILGHVSIAAADYKDLGGCKILTQTGIGLVMKMGAGATTLYIAGVTGGTPTHTASGLRFKLGFLRA